MYIEQDKNLLPSRSGYYVTNCAKIQTISKSASWTFIRGFQTRIRGDRIGRIIAYWAIVFFEQFFENYESSLNIWAIFPHSLGFKLILAKHGFGLILGDFSQTYLVTLPRFYLINFF
jgi:hypothetical protein